MSVFSTISPFEIIKDLREGNESATFVRLGKSKHVADLRLIFSTTVLILLTSSVLALAINFLHDPDVYNAVLDSGKFIGAIGAVGGGILAWTYQAGSARLGVVDLFACEISTLCRVVAVVDTVHRYLDKFDQGPPAEPAGANTPGGPAHKFTSLENYFPVFESNTRDLQALEARVVINITAFYTYMKAVRDAMRSLAEFRREPASSSSPLSNTAALAPWQEAVRNVVYMLFLGLESARNAISDLVEFEPEKAERTIVILISELEAFRFLRRQFSDKQDVRYQRIMMREPDYKRLYPKIKKLVDDNTHGDKLEPEQVSLWEPAAVLLRRLEERYDAAIVATS